MFGKMGLNTKVTAEELKKHSTPNDTWLTVNGVVWDLTQFAPEHPGGAESKSIASSFHPCILSR